MDEYEKRDKDSSDHLKSSKDDGDVSNASDKEIEAMEADIFESDGISDITSIKQEIIKQTPKPSLDTAELETILATGNFTSSLVKQIQSERKRSHQELDMAELNSVLTEGNFTTDIISQIMRKMNNPNSTINLQTISMQESKKRKSEEWEDELRRFKKRFV